MKVLKAAEFPELQRVFSGYLHEDFHEEYATPAAALRSFYEDANPDERQRLRSEASRLLDRIDRIPMTGLRALLSALGCRWMPPSRKALVALLAEIAARKD